MTRAGFKLTKNNCFDFVINPAADRQIDKKD